MKNRSLLVCAALFAQLSAQSQLPQHAGDARRPVHLPDVSARTTWPLDRVLFDRPAADQPLWAMGRTWKAGFDGRGVSVIPFFGSDAAQDFPLRVELARATVGGVSLPLAAGEPVVEGGVVRTARGALTEVVATGLEQVEQSFVFAKLPNRGAIAVDVHIGGDYTPSVIDGGLRFANELGAVDYSQAVAIDAAGQRLPLAIEWNGRAAHIEIPAAFVATAQLPIVLDPVLNYWYWLGNPSLTQHDGDVAVLQVPNPDGRTLLVWQRRFSATDNDVWGLMFDSGLGLVQTDFIIDVSTQDWTKVAVASNRDAQNFLVVAEVRLSVPFGSTYHIAGRIVAANAAVASVFDIEHAGVVGLAGDSFSPDVGGDSYPGISYYAVVFQKYTSSSADIYMKMLTPAGALVSTSPIALATTSLAETHPRISKSCGHEGPLEEYWLVTWQCSASGTNEDVHGRFVNWYGVLPALAFPIATSGAMETAPVPGSPIDQDGVRYWPVAYEHAATLGQPRDVAVRLMNVAGTSPMNPFIASSNVPNSDDHAPDVDGDGIRFVVTMTTGISGSPRGVEAATFAYLPSLNTWREEERTNLSTSSTDDYDQTSVCAEYGGGIAPTPNYALCFTEQATNTLRLERYGAYVGGSFFATRATQCGTLGIAASGSSALGQTVTVTVTNSPLSVAIGGFPLTLPLLPVFGCDCVLGVDYVGFFGNPFTYTIPDDTTMVGTTFSVQGITIGGTACIGLDLSDTIDFTVR